MDITQFGKDHWSLLAYVECCCVDNHGRIDLSRISVNEPRRIPLRSNGLGWNPEWATRIKGGSIPDPNHDDMDCLDDLENAGLLEQIGTVINPMVKLTDKGLEAATKLRQHKMSGGQFNTFEPSTGKL